MAFETSDNVVHEEGTTQGSLVKSNSSAEPVEDEFSKNFGDLVEEESLKAEITSPDTCYNYEKTCAQIIDEKQSSQEISSSDSKSNSKRSDIDLKYSIRALRKYFRDQFRTHHARLINRRIVNCSPKEVYNAVDELLKDTLNFPDCNKDIIFYFIGILSLKQVNRMAWSQTIKCEVKEFLDCVRVFSKAKFKRIFKSKTLCRICKYFIGRGINAKAAENLEKYTNQA